MEFANMKRQLITVVILALAATGIFALVYYQRDQAPTQVWGGKVIEVKDGSIVVEGVVRYVDQAKSDKQETKTIEFRISPGTILTNRVTKISREQAENGGRFYPQRENISGKIEDLKVGTAIHTITSPANLFRVKQTVAAEIIYTTYEMAGF